MASPPHPPIHAVLWRRLDREGHEGLRLADRKDGFSLAGTAQFLDEGEPCQLSYEISCDPDGRTRTARVHGWIGRRPVHHELALNQHWSMDGRDYPGLDGCLDLDLQFSPATNALPLRRLQLRVGERAVLRVAYLRFPEFHLECLAQGYTRLDRTHYRYERLDDVEFMVELELDAQGLVLTYPGLCTAVPASSLP